MKKIIPNIAIKNCKEALEYYKEVFGGEVTNVQVAGEKEWFKGQNEMMKGQEGKIIHSELHINNDCIIYITDPICPESEISTSSNINLFLQLDSEEEINRLYATLKEEGKVKFELQKTFWGSYHAAVTDRYGTLWSLDYHIE